MSRSILFTFDVADKGGTKMEAEGFHGRGCDSTIKSFASKMRSSRIEGDTEHLPEYYEYADESEEELDG